MYSHLSNKHGGWKNLEGEAKIAKLLEREGWNLRGGWKIFMKSICKRGGGIFFCGEWYFSRALLLVYYRDESKLKLSNKNSTYQVLTIIESWKWILINMELGINKEGDKTKMDFDKRGCWNKRGGWKIFMKSINA